MKHIRSLHRPHGHDAPRGPQSADWQKGVKELQERLGYAFRDASLLVRALTHSSYAHEYGLGEGHNERQEFLGDAVAQICVSWELYTRFPQAREGDLTRLRSMLVSTASFADMARETGMDKLLLLGRGEASQGGAERDSVLSDVFEAVLAAVYEDGGFEAAQKTVARLFATVWPVSADAGRKKEQDHKTWLQELVQHVFDGDRPVYTQLAMTGPSHAREFTVKVTLPDGSFWTGSGTSCKKAEQNAAARAGEELRVRYADVLVKKSAD